MDEWVTTKQASEIKKVGLSAHRIAELASCGDIVADRTGEKKWLVKVTLNDGKWELVPTDKPKQKPANSTQPKQETARTPAYEEFLAFLRGWREQVQLREQFQSPSLWQLLDGFLFQNRHEHRKHITDSEQADDLHVATLVRHSKAVSPGRPLPCESSILFKRLRDLHPESGVWQAQELFDRLQSDYLVAFLNLLKWLSSVESTRHETAKASQELNRANGADRDLLLWSRLFTLTVACDILALGIGEQDPDAFWVAEENGIMRFRRTIVDTGIKELPKDCCQPISETALLFAKLIWKIEPEQGSHLEAKQKTTMLLEKCLSLQRARESVLIELEKLDLTLL